MVKFSFISEFCLRYPILQEEALVKLPSSQINFSVKMLNRVVLPAPLTPTRPACSPFSNLRDIFLKIVLSPKLKLRFSIFNILMSLYLRKIKKERGFALSLKFM